jgi:streptogramin lyase
MAGIHQIWTCDPLGRVVEVAAGTTNEGLRDGALSDAWFAQTSGLAPVDDTLWLADSETSALRRITGGRVETVVGTGLFDFGLRDGPARQALLQHPVGVTALPDGSVAVCDTYNDAVRRYDPATGAVTTLATGLREPSGAVVDGEHLVVVESAAHRLTRLPLGAAAVAVEAFALRTHRPVTEIAAGDVEVIVSFEPPPGQKLDDRYGPATRLVISATPGALLRAGEGRGTALTRSLEIDPITGEGVLHVAAMAASCEDDTEHAACHMHQQDWGVPVRVVDRGARRLELVLSG